jgi:hypothetical protein
VPLRQYLSDTINKIGYFHGDMFCLPSILHRQAETGRHGGASGEIQKEIRHVKGPMACGLIKGILSLAKSPYLFLHSTLRLTEFYPEGKKLPA